MSVVTLRWDDANLAAQLDQPLPADDSAALDQELAILVANGSGQEFLNARLEVAKHVFFKLELYAARQQDNHKFGKADYAKDQVRKALRKAGYY